MSQERPPSRLLNFSSLPKVIYGKTRKEVADKLKALHRDLAAGLNIAPEQLTVEEFLNRWLKEVVCHRRPRTQESYKGTVRLHIVPQIGSHKLQKLAPEHVQSMLNSLRAKSVSPHSTQTLGPRTVEYACLVLSRALNQAVKWGYISRNVAQLVETPRAPKQKISPLDEQQARALLERVRGHRYEALYRIALSLGLRRGEVLGLRWEDVNFQKQTLTVSGSLQRQNGRLERSTPKTDASRRVLPLPTVLAQALLAQKTRQDNERAVAGDDWCEHGLIFTTVVGTPIEPRGLIRHFKKVLKLAGLPEATRFHDLRHSCATLLIAQGVHPRVVIEILGHANISMTMNTYAHVLPEVSRQAADKLDALFTLDKDEDQDGDADVAEDDIQAEGDEET